MILSCIVPLPPRFRSGEILAFHRRDPLGVAERVDEANLTKGLIWAGVPSRLTFRFGRRAVETELAIDGDAGAADRDACATLTRRMLGLDQDVERFERRFGKHPSVGRLIERQRGLRVPVAATPFEALTWAITGQQISVGAAVALRRKLIVAAGARHADGLACYPDAARVAALSEADLRNAGFSGGKAATLRTVAARVVDGTLPLDAWAAKLPAAEATERLLAVRGIGPWTVNYALLRGFGWLDGSLHGDAGVRRGLQNLLGEPAAISDARAREWLSEFSPWRALVAAHLWAWQSPASAVSPS